MSNFTVDHKKVENILGWIKSGEIAIPEIQRPFVWNSTKVRDLIDSLYNDFPIGYIIVWKSQDTRLKNGQLSLGKKILIDGQQRVIALQAAILGEEIVDNQFKKKPITISFNPLEEKFEVCNSAILKDNKWIPDISQVFNPNFSEYMFIPDYCNKNQIQGKEKQISDVITKLKQILSLEVGVIELDHNIGLDKVSEIFIRINSKGVELSQADFAMSKISSDSKYNGIEIRKLIDYFSHLIKSPSDYELIKENDKDLLNSNILQKIGWIIKEQENIYNPDYKDILRVSFTHKFCRGKMADLISLLSGRNFDSQENLEPIAEDSFSKLRLGVESFVSETNYKRFIMILNSLGIIDASLVSSKNILNFAYILYLTLREKQYNHTFIEKIVRKWVVISMLTGRYSGSSESKFDSDIHKFTELEPELYVKQIEESELSDAFWNNILIDKLNTSLSNSPYFLVFLMAQIKNNARGFLSSNIQVRDLKEQRGDIHHIFPKKYLQKNGIENKKDYNQIANYVYTQSEINIKIKDEAPCVYINKIKEQINRGENKLCSISKIDDLLVNYKENSIPDSVESMDYSNYQEFLVLRRKLMAKYIRDYYKKISD